MEKDMSYEAVMGRNFEIMRKAVGMDYSRFESKGIGFDYEKMMEETGYTLKKLKGYKLKQGLAIHPYMSYEI